MDDQLFIGYVPAFKDSKHEQDWKLAFRQQRSGKEGVVIRRVVWDNCRDPHSRLLVDVAEGFTAKDAASRLEAVEREGNVDLQRGASDRLGPLSLSFSKDKPWSQMIRRANLAIWVYSCGKTCFDVSEWVDRIDRDLEPESTAVRKADLVLMPDDPVEGSGAIGLRFSLQWARGEFAWWKFRATGAKLEKDKGNRVLLWPDPDQKDPSVTGWAVEPGRETYWGRYP